MTGGDRAHRFRRSRADAAAASDSGQAAGAGQGWRIALLGAAFLGALLLAFLILRFSVAGALLETGPEAAARIAPRQPHIHLERAFDEIQIAGDPSVSTEQAALAAFRRAPLSEVPLLIGARRAAARGDEERADRLVAVAARRNPRSRYIRLVELDYHIRNGRIDEAAASMAVLTRLFSDVGSFLVAELGRMSTDPAARPAVRRVMETDPQIRTSLLEQLARDGADPAMILELAGPQAPSAAGAEAPRWQRLLLDRMIERGDVARAFQLWTRLVGVDPASVRGGVYDPAFEGLPGPPPFNWSFVSGSDGFAERSGGRGELEAQYYGRRDAQLASQLVRLAPGSYRLGFEADGDADGTNSRLSWTLTCYPDGSPLVEVPIAGVNFSTKRFSEAFAVPASGCSGQWLRLVGDAAEFPKEQRVAIRGFAIEEVGRP